MDNRLKFIAAISALSAPLMAAPSLSFAQAAGPTVITFPVTGSVSRLCSLGLVTGGDQTFALGSLIDTTTGLLLTTLGAPAKTVTGSWCNAPSTINISATTLAAVGVTTAAPTGFTNGVNYTATASGWTTTPAAFVVGSAANGAASQPAGNATSGVITVGIGSFAPNGGAALRPVAATAYSGQVVLTLAIQP